MLLAAKKCFLCSSSPPSSIVAEGFLGNELVFPSQTFVQAYGLVYSTLIVLKGLVVLVLYIAYENLIFSFSNNWLF